MKRLPEPFEVVDPNETYGAALLEHVRPLEPSATRKRRVWTALERTGGAKRPKARMRAPIIAVFVLSGATAASATLPGLWKRLQPSNADVAAITSDAKESLSSPQHAPPILPTSATISSEPISGESRLPENRTAPTAKAVETAPMRRKQPAEKSHFTPELADPPASAALVVEAIRERRAGNLARAKELSSEYRAKYPGGALQEEALALSIEAAAALGDDEARGLATLYLRRYPHGRFRAQAQRVVGASR